MLFRAIAELDGLARGLGTQASPEPTLASHRLWRCQAYIRFEMEAKSMFATICNEVSALGATLRVVAELTVPIIGAIYYTVGLIDRIRGR
jgi:hypothetical protein